MGRGGGAGQGVFLRMGGRGGGIGGGPASRGGRAGMASGGKKAGILYAVPALRLARSEVVV